MKNKDIYEYHGWRTQCKHVIEEAYELSEAIHDFENKQSLNNWNHICEEVADVTLMLSEITQKYDVDKEILDNWIKYKKNREIKRIKDGYYEK